MLRPADPSWSVLTWDTGNYPAGSNDWNGTAKRVAPAGTYISPTDGAGAQNGNYLWGAGFDVDVASKTFLTNLTHLVGQNPALNWFPKTTSSSTKNTNRAAWSTKDEAWFAVGNASADSGVVTYDYGRTWADLTLGSSLSCLDVAVDNSTGNVSIIAIGSRTVYYGTRSAYGSITFAATTLALSVSPSGGGLTHDDINTKFIACYRNGTSGHKVDTSAGGTVWAAQTIPGAWTAYTGTNSPQVHTNPIGVTIACFYDDTAGFLRVMRSPDGGTTWTAVASLNTTFGPSLVQRPTYDASNGVWWIAYSTTAGSRQTELVRSLDGGVTWTAQFKTFTGTNDLFCNGIVALGDLLVMVNDDGRVCWSVDGAGASWFWAGRNPQTTAGTASSPLGLRGGGGGLLLLNVNDRVAYASNRFGDEGQAV